MENYREEQLRNRLTPLQYRVTQECCTQPAFESRKRNSQISTMIISNKASIIALSAIMSSFHQLTNMKHSVDGQPSTKSYPKPRSNISSIRHQVQQKHSYAAIIATATQATISNEPVNPPPKVVIVSTVLVYHSLLLAKTDLASDLICLYNE